MRLDRAFCIDSSVALSWVFADEHRQRTDALLETLATRSAVAPAIWPLEVTNAILTAERRGRISAVQATDIIEALRSLPIEVMDVAGDTAFDSVFGLARRVGLSSYDASYLATSIRLGLPLATNDSNLAAAAVALGVDTV